MMSRQTLLALASAIVLGLIAVFLANAYLNGAQQKAYAGGTTKVAVATASTFLRVHIVPLQRYCRLGTISLSSRRHKHGSGDPRPA